MSDCVIPSIHQDRKRLIVSDSGMKTAMLDLKLKTPSRNEFLRLRRESVRKLRDYLNDWLEGDCR